MDSDAAEDGEAPGPLEMSGSLFSNLCSSPEGLLEGRDGDEDGQEGVDGAVEILTAETLRHSWNTVAASSAGYHAAAGVTQQLSIPKEGGHDDLDSGMDPYGIVNMDASGGGQPQLREPPSVSSQSATSHHGPQNTSRLPTRDNPFAQSADRQFGGFAAGEEEGLGFLGGGLSAWDLGMLDRMQAADVYSGMPGIDHNLSDSEDASDGEGMGEDSDDDADDSDDDAPDNEDDESEQEDLTDEWAGECACLGGFG